MRKKLLGIIICTLLIGITVLAATSNININGNWQWAKRAGGITTDYGYGIAVDGNGNTYITGVFEGPADFGTTTLTNPIDVFIAKLDTNGNWQWAKQVEGTWDDYGYDIAVDEYGNVYITGEFGGYGSGTADFGTTTLASQGRADIFVARLDTNGNWQWAKRAGGSWYDKGYGVSVDRDGNTYITGRFRYTADFGTTTLTSQGYLDVFIAKLDTNGNWQWAKQAGGTNYDIGRDVAVDDDGNIYITGGFNGTADFGPYSLTSKEGLYEDVFIAKLDTNGNWQWAIRAGGTSGDEGCGVAVDEDGNIYITGGFQGTADFGTTTLTSQGTADVFIAKLDTNGNWQWAKRAGGITYDNGYGVSMDSDRNTYITGFFEGIANFGTITLISQGWSDVFIAKLDTNGNWQWAIRAGGGGIDCGLGISVDTNGITYITGFFPDIADFGTIPLISQGDYDVFVAKCKNQPPNKPTCSYDRSSDELVVTATDPDENQVKYGIDWDKDENVDQWTALVDSGTEQRIDCGGKKGTVGVIAEDEHGAQSEIVSVTAKSKQYISRPFDFLQNYPRLLEILKCILLKL